MLKKASNCIFSLLQLRRCGTSRKVMWNVYNALIRSVVTFSYPVLCNMPDSLFSKFINLERRVAKIIGCPPTVNVKDFSEKLCVSLLYNVVVNNSHPLRALFTFQNQTEQKCATRAQNRISHNLSAPTARTSRYFNSFISFMRNTNK